MYHIFVTVYWLYVDKVHLTPQGFKLCLAYINLLNRPIKAGTIRAIVALHGSLPTIILPPVLITTQYLLNPYWIVGFVCGEGSFTYFCRSRLTSSGVKLDYTLVFEVSQLPLDNLLLLAILQYLGAGNLFTRQDFVSRIRVTSTVNLLNLVAPFFHSLSIIWS